jgi:hypothetical protein
MPECFLFSVYGRQAYVRVSSTLEPAKARQLGVKLTVNAITPSPRMDPFTTIGCPRIQSLQCVVCRGPVASGLLVARSVRRRARTGCSSNGAAAVNR